jgi:hypothetical protein
LAARGAWARSRVPDRLHVRAPASSASTSGSDLQGRDAAPRAFRLAAHDRSGVYEPLLEPVVGSAGRYYAEFFDVARATRDDVRAA